MSWDEVVDSLQTVFDSVTQVKALPKPLNTVHAAANISIDLVQVSPDTWKATLSDGAGMVASLAVGFSIGYVTTKAAMAAAAIGRGDWSLAIYYQGGVAIIEIQELVSSTVSQSVLEALTTAEFTEFEQSVGDALLEAREKLEGLADTLAEIFEPTPSGSITIDGNRVEIITDENPDLIDIGEIALNMRGSNNLDYPQFPITGSVYVVIYGRVGPDVVERSFEVHDPDDLKAIAKGLGIVDGNGEGDVAAFIQAQSPETQDALEQCIIGDGTMVLQTPIPVALSAGPSYTPWVARDASHLTLQQIFESALRVLGMGGGDPLVSGCVSYS